jgi:hypothetical protein
VEKQIVAVPFAGGIDSKTDPSQVVAGKVLALQNGILSQTGLVSRRWGYTALGMGIVGGGTIATTLAVTAFGNELLTYDGKSAYSFIEAENAWSARGNMVPVVQSDKTIIAGNYQQLSPDHASLGGIDVYAWEDSRGAIRYSVFDTASGTAIVLDQGFFGASAGRPKLLPVPSANVILIVCDTGGGTLATGTISPSNPTGLTFVASPIAGVIAPCWFDACVAPNGTVFIAYYKIVAGNLTVQVSALNAAFTALVWTNTAWTYSGTTQVNGLACYTDSSSHCWVTIADNSSGVETLIYTSAGAVFLAAIHTTISSFTPVAVAAIVVGGTATVFAEHVQTGGGSQSYRHTLKAFTITSGGSVTTPVVIGYGLGIASKPLSWNGQVLINCAFQTQMQPCYVCIAWNGTTTTIVSRTLYGIGGGYLNNQDWMVPECQQLTAGVFVYANGAKGIPNTEAGTILSLLGVNATTLNFSSATEQLSSAINGSLYTVGGILQRYDGHLYVEAGFLVWPEEVTFAPATTGGLMAAGTYFYSVTYEYLDAFGFAEPSNPLPPVQVTVGGAGAGSVAITIPTLFLTNKTGVRLVVYRTTASGTLLYRVTSAVAPTYNPYPLPLTATTTFTDTLADASIQSNGLLYTQPLAQGNPVLPNFAPPACTLIATYANRVWTNTTDDPYTLFYSQQSIEGAPAQFCAALNLRVDPDGGPITAIARMDANFFIFKKNSIFYITGQGPDATGAQSDLGSPTQLPTGNIGCAQANTIVLTQMGLMFQSNTGGIYLLDRSLNCTYKGAPVESFTKPGSGQGIQFTAAALIPDQWVIFTSPGGTALAYDYYYDQWSTFTGTPHLATDSDVYHGGGDVLALSNATTGEIYIQTPATFTDAGAPIPFELVTAWLNPTAIQGYQRLYHVYVLGQYISAHTMNLSAHVDYDSVSTPIAATIQVPTAPSNPSNYQWRLDVLKKCQSFQLTITDSQSAPGGAGFSLSALSLVVGVKRGGNKNLPTSRQIGMS